MYSFYNVQIEMKIILDTYLQKAKKSLMDSRNSRNRNLNRITDELQGVQQIMIQNIDDVLQRGETLSGKFVFAALIYKEESFCVRNFRILE